VSGAADGHTTPFVWVWVRCPPLPRPTGPFPKSADNSLHKVFRRWTSISEDNDLGRAPGPPPPPPSPLSPPWGWRDQGLPASAVGAWPRSEGKTMDVWISGSQSQVGVLSF